MKKKTFVDNLKKEKKDKEQNELKSKKSEIETMKQLNNRRASKMFSSSLGENVL